MNDIETIAESNIAAGRLKVGSQHEVILQRRSDGMRSHLWSMLGVAWFELRRSFSPGRLSLWFLIAMFPTVLVAMVRAQAGSDAPNEAFVLLLFFLIVRVASVMGLLLWSTPLISNEIEGKTWLYVATRPYGSSGIVWGKYAVALLWSISAGFVSTTSAVIASGVEDAWKTWLVINVLMVLGCFAYGALYTLIGSIIQRRAMVVAIIYTVVVEGVLSMVPATINRFTIGYRLMGLLLQWMGLDEGQASEQYQLLYSDTSALLHILVLVGLTTGMAFVAVLRVRAGGYLTEPEG